MADVYTKTQNDASFLLKANVVDVYTKTLIDSYLALKANVTDSHSKTVVDTYLSLKSNAADVYTKTQNDASFALKANVADVYTKALVDSYLALKANASNAIFTNLLQGQTAYFSGNVSMASVLNLQNNLNVAGTSSFNGPVSFTGTVTGLPVYTSGSLNLGNVANTAPSGLPISTATQTALNLKANSADVYTTTQINTSLALKANAAEVYTKTQNDASFALKANVADVYTKTQNDASFLLKANVADSYTKTQIDSSLALKANVADYYTKTLIDNSLALKANANNADITGYIQTNQLKMLGVPTTSIYADTSKGFIIHPTRLQFAISSLATPAINESVIAMDNSLIYLNRPVYIPSALLTGQEALFNGNITALTNLNVQGNLDVYGTSSFNGPVNFTGSVSGLPVYSLGTLGLGNVANTSPSGLPISTAAQTALNLKANSADVYTTTQIDSSLALKANVADVYTKTQNNVSFALKANVADVYTKTQNDASFLLKANVADVYTKTQNDASFLLKANVADVYTKTLNDASFALKANVADVYTKAAVDTALALRATTDNAVFTGYITTNNLKLLGVPNTSTVAYVNTSKGLIIHPNSIRLAISSLDTPLTTESVISADNTSVVLNRDVYCIKKLIGQDAFFWSDITASTNLNVQGNLDVYGTTNLNGPVNFTGPFTGLPSALGLENVANTAPSDLPVNTATQTALNLKANITDMYSTFANQNVQFNLALDLKANKLNPTFTNNVSVLSSLTVSGTTTFNSDVVGITSSMVGLGNVANTAPIDLPVSTATTAAIAANANATTTALALKANLANPNFSGNITMNKCQIGDNFPAAATSLHVSGSTSMTLDLTLGRALTVGGNTTVLGNTTMASNLNVLLPAQFDGTILGNENTTLMKKCSIGVNNSATPNSLYVSGSTYISTDLALGGNIVLGNIAQKIGIGVNAESSIHTQGFKITTPTKEGVHIGMDVAAGFAGITLAAGSSSQSSYVDFTYPNVLGKGRIQYNHTNNSMLFSTNGSQKLTLDTNGFLGVGATTPLGSLQVSGAAPTTYPGVASVCAGYDPAVVANPTLSLVGGTSSALPHIDFRKPGQANGSVAYTNFIGRIACDFNNGCLIFTTQQGESFRCDGANANATVLIGTITAQPTYKLYVNGNAFATNFTSSGTITSTGTINAGIFTAGSVASTGIISGPTFTCSGTGTFVNISCTGNMTSTGAFNATGSKNFDIKHPFKEGYRLRHRCMEGPLAYLFYHFQYDCKVGYNEFAMPDYFDVMNTDVLVYVSPYEHFGCAWGKTDKNKLIIKCSIDGTYNIQVIGTRNDKVIQDEHSKFGVEYPDSLLSQ